MDSRCKRCWAYWAVASLTSFTYLEARAYRHRCHRTLSRELRQVLGVHPRRPWGQVSPLVFIAFGAWLSHHLITLAEEQPCFQPSSGATRPKGS
jgi:hypothetical protein